MIIPCADAGSWKETAAMTATLPGDLPQAYRDTLHERALAPLWDFLKAALPHGRPPGPTEPHCWRYEEIRPLLLESGRLVPVEKAERRVLVLSDPGRGADAMQATGTIYAGIQLLLPGETAPTHRHTPSAARIVIEGEGGYTIVNGHKCAMERGDLILTPSGQWHDHGHEGTKPVTWLDVLDLPFFTAAESSYAERGTPESNGEEPLVAFGSELRRLGLAPAAEHRRPNPYPMLRFPWRQTRDALLRLRRTLAAEDAVELAYINPETGESCLPIMGFTAMLLPPGRVRAPKPRSSSAVFHVVEGRGRSRVDEARFAWGPGDTFSAPTFAALEHQAEAGDAPGFLIRVDDEPMQRKLGFFAERASGF
jgi:gentisate 1,2-dioxygenase